MIDYKKAFKGLQGRIKEKADVYARLIDWEGEKAGVKGDVVLSGALAGIRMVLDDFIPEALKQAGGRRRANDRQSEC